MCAMRRDAFRRSVRFNVDINITIITGAAHHVEKKPKKKNGKVELEFKFSYSKTHAIYISGSHCCYNTINVTTPCWHRNIILLSRGRDKIERIFLSQKNLTVSRTSGRESPNRERVRADR